MVSTKKEQPSCPYPFCTNGKGKIITGASLGKYAYQCETCNTQWQQIPPYKLKPGQDPGITLCNRNGRSSNRSKGYKCKFCGLPKKNHVCKMSFSLPKYPTECEVCELQGSYNSYKADNLLLCRGCNKVCIHATCLSPLETNYMCAECEELCNEVQPLPLDLKRCSWSQSFCAVCGDIEFDNHNCLVTEADIYNLFPLVATNE